MRLEGVETKTVMLYDVVCVNDVPSGNSSRWNPHGLSLQYSMLSWNVRMPAPCPVPVITASSDTQNRLYKPARLPVRCLSGAKQGEIDPSMDHRNRFLRLIRQCFPTSTALQPFEPFRTGTKFLSNKFWAKLRTWDIPSQLVTLGIPETQAKDCAKPRAKRSLDGMKWSWNFCIRLFTDDQTYGMVPDRHCTVSCSKNSDLLVTSTPQTMVMWLQWSVFGTFGNQCKPVAQVRAFLDLFVDNSDRWHIFDLNVFLATEHSVNITVTSNYMQFNFHRHERRVVFHKRSAAIQGMQVQ